MIKGTYHPMSHEQIFHREDTPKECMMMGVVYVQAIVDSLNKKFHDLHVFNTFKLFSPKYYPSVNKVCIIILEQ